jgi:hypothetical protein
LGGEIAGEGREERRGEKRIEGKGNRERALGEIFQGEIDKTYLILTRPGTICRYF